MIGGISVGRCLYGELRRVCINDGLIFHQIFSGSNPPVLIIKKSKIRALTLV